MPYALTPYVLTGQHSHEVSETAAADQLATVHPKQRGCSDYCCETPLCWYHSRFTAEG